MPRWWAVLGVGLAIWVAATGVTILTRDIITLPTVVLTDYFLVPVTAVVWYLDHEPSATLSPRRRARIEPPQPLEIEAALGSGHGRPRERRRGGTRAGDTEAA